MLSVFSLNVRTTMSLVVIKINLIQDTINIEMVGFTVLLSLISTLMICVYPFIISTLRRFPLAQAFG
jgi:hypothetical protein